MPSQIRKPTAVSKLISRQIPEDTNREDAELYTALDAAVESSGILTLDSALSGLQWGLSHPDEKDEGSTTVMPIKPLWSWGGDLKFVNFGTAALITGASGVGKSALCGTMAQSRAQWFRELILKYSPETVDERGFIPALRAVVSNTDEQDGIMSFSAVRAWDIIKDMQQREIEDTTEDIRDLLARHKPSEKQIAATINAAEHLKRRWRGKIAYLPSGKLTASQIIKIATPAIEAARKNGLQVRQFFIDYLQDVIVPQAVSKGLYPNYEHNIRELIEWSATMRIHLVIFSQMRKGDAMIAKTMGDAELDAAAGVSENPSKLHIILTQDQDDEGELTGLMRMRVTKNNVGLTMRNQYALVHAELERFRYNFDKPATIQRRKKVRKGRQNG